MTLIPAPSIWDTLSDTMPKAMPGDEPRWDVLLAEIEDIIRSTPPRETIDAGNPDAIAWLGRAAAAMERWDYTKTPTINGIVHDVESLGMVENARGISALFTMLQRSRADLRLEVAPLSVGIAAGGVFDYFDEVRKAMTAAQSEVFFVDPYLDAEFVSRYLPHVRTGVGIRLLAGKKMPELLTAIDLFAQQARVPVGVRGSEKFHDRFLFVDRSACYLSGASFKDGAKKAPTVLAQITDGFRSMLDTYEQVWLTAKVER